MQRQWRADSCGPSPEEWGQNPLWHRLKWLWVCEGSWGGAVLNLLLFLLPTSLFPPRALTAPISGEITFFAFSLFFFKGGIYSGWPKGLNVLLSWLLINIPFSLLRAVLAELPPTVRKVHCTLEDFEEPLPTRAANRNQKPGAHPFAYSSPPPKMQTWWTQNFVLSNWNNSI